MGDCRSSYSQVNPEVSTVAISALSPLDFLGVIDLLIRRNARRANDMEVHISDCLLPLLAWTM
jgi:hypothetical protein